MGNSEKSILIVDDDASILAACAESLMLDGYRVEIAESGEKAIQLIPKKPYDLIVTDLMMGQVDGLGVLEFAKRISPKSEVIVLTAFGNIETAVEAMKLGAYDYLTKPFDPHRLDVAVRRAFEHQTLLKELSGLKEILALYDATKSLSTIRDEKELLHALARFACELTNSAGCSILTVSSDDKTLTVEATHGARHGILLGRHLAADAQRLAALNTDALGTMNTLEARRYFQFDSVPGYSEITSSLSVPIFFKDRLMAVMNLSRAGDTPSFQNDELRMITIFTAQAGYALENSRLFDSLSTQSNQEVFRWLLDACQKIMSLPGAQFMPPMDKNRVESLMTQCKHALKGA